MYPSPVFQSWAPAASYMPSNGAYSPLSQLNQGIGTNSWSNNIDSGFWTGSFPGAGQAAAGNSSISEMLLRPIEQFVQCMVERIIQGVMQKISEMLNPSSAQTSGVSPLSEMPLCRASQQPTSVSGTEALGGLFGGAFSIDQLLNTASGWGGKLNGIVDSVLNIGGKALGFLTGGSSGGTGGGLGGLVSGIGGLVAGLF